MSRLFSGTPFERPAICDVCGRAPADCICVNPKTANVILPEKKRMAERPGGKNFGQTKSGYQLNAANSDPPKDQVARIHLEKRKGNREVTVISGLEHPGNDLPKLLTDLKTSLGCGGAVQGRTLELQGDHARRAADFLTARGQKALVRK